MKTLIILLSYCFILNSTNALETDQFMTWGIELKDSTEYVNNYIHENISNALKGVSPKYSCEKAAIASMDWNGRTTDMLSKIEHDMYHSPKVDRFPPISESDRGVIKGSIYKDVAIFKLKIFGVNLQMNGIYFGVDKLGHFITVGRDYYKSYWRLRKKGKSVERSMLKAVKRGIFSERTYYGYLVSGVFSFADLESNFQGLLFMRTMCEGDNPLLVKNKSGQWSLSRKVDITKYVTPKWDESFYPNTYKKSRFKQIRPYMENYCEKMSEKSVLDRFKYYYQNDKDNFNSLYLDKLIEKKKLKNPAFQNLSFVCWMKE